jgi:hypothetical protein
MNFLVAYFSELLVNYLLANFHKIKIALVYDKFLYFMISFDEHYLLYDFNYE